MLNHHLLAHPADAIKRQYQLPEDAAPPWPCGGLLMRGGRVVEPQPPAFIEARALGLMRSFDFMHLNDLGEVAALAGSLKRRTVAAALTGSTGTADATWGRLEEVVEKAATDLFGTAGLGVTVRYALSPPEAFPAGPTGRINPLVGTLVANYYPLGRVLVVVREAVIKPIDWPARCRRTESNLRAQPSYGLNEAARDVD